MNDGSVVTVPYDVSVNPKYPDKALDFEHPITFLNLARREVVKAWNNFMNSICQTEPKVGMEWSGQCRVFVSKLRDKLCYFSALYPAQGGQYNFDPWEVVQEEVAHVGYYLTGQYLDMFGIGGNDAQKADQFARIQEWYYAQRNKIGRWGEVKIWGAKFGPTFDQYVKLTGPMMKDGSTPSESSPYQQRNVLEQFWGVNGKVAKKEYGSWENLGYLFRIVQQSALGDNGERWDYVLSQDDLTKVEGGTLENPIYKVHDEFHELRKQVRAMWINLREYPEIMPSAWASLTIDGPGGGFALWDTATMTSKQVDGHSMLKALFDNDDKHKGYYKSWGWSDEMIWLAEALALGGYYHIDLEGPGRVAQTLETQASWDLVERFGFINDQMMDYRFGVAAGKDSVWVENQKKDINNKWMYLKRWLVRNNLKSLLTGIVNMLPATSCSASKQPTTFPTASPTSVAPTMPNATFSPTAPITLAPSTLAPSAEAPTSQPAPTPVPIPVVDEIVSLDDVPSSVDEAVPLPGVLNGSALAGKNALLVVSHGSDQYQTLYIHQYLQERGVSVDFVCPTLAANQTHAVLMDVFKPAYLVACSPLAGAKLLSYNIVVVIGGSVAASDLRLQADFIKKLGEFWSTSGKILVCISTGSEVLIEAGVAAQLSHLVVHPSSMWSFRKLLQYNKKLPAGGGDGDAFNRTAGSAMLITPQRASLILNKETAMLSETVIQIGKAFGLTGEEIDENNTRVMNNISTSGDSVFTVIKSMSQLPIVSPRMFNITATPCDEMSGKTVGIILASGADSMQVNYVMNHATRCNATTFVVCSADTFIYDGGWAYLLSSPPARLEGKVQCSMDLEKLLLEYYQKGGKPELDVLIIPGGPASTDMVLRSDALLNELIGRQIGAGRVLALLGTGASVLLASDLVPKSKLGASRYAKTDLLHSGYMLPADMQSVEYKQVFAEAEDPENPHPSGLGFLVVGTGDSVPDLLPFAKSISSALRGEGHIPEGGVVNPDKPVPSGGDSDDTSGASVEAIVLPIIVLLVLIGAGVLWFVKHSQRNKPNLQLQQSDEVLDVLSSHPQDYAQLR